MSDAKVEGIIIFYGDRTELHIYDDEGNHVATKLVPDEEGEKIAKIVKPLLRGE